MNTNSLKRFATTARNILMRGVRDRLESVGFNEDGTVKEAPHSVEGGMVFYGELITDPNFVPRWETLRQRIATHGVKEVVEEAAYTWFNRLMAIRILVRNGLALPALDYENPDVRLPRIVTYARAGKTPVLSASDRTELDRVISNGRLAFEQFAILIRAYCDNNAIIRECFGGITDYTSLLLPADILAPDGFIELLNNADSFISPEDYTKAELIGWLYQFYISERKDEVFAKKGKVEADEIPAATQIFTPNWIVKYMVQNTILPQVEADEEIIEKSKYLVKTENTEESRNGEKISLEDLKVADFACGSGHILNECFDLLMDLYESEFYSPREAIECIFTKNLTGIDIDLRAKQLATFALLLKACQKDTSFRDAHCIPHVFSFPDVHRDYFRDVIGHFVAAYPNLSTDCYSYPELYDAFSLFEEADELGSIMKFNVSEGNKKFMKAAVEQFDKNPQYVREFLPLIEAFRIILALTDYYDAIVMNPPYMPTSKVEGLKEYAAKNYPDSKTDLFSVFMDVCIDRLKEGGKYGMINMQSWMFLSSFETLRKKIIEQQHIDSLLHLGPRTFDELSGEVVQNAAFVISKEKPSTPGVYYRLIDGKNCNAKCEMFLSGENRYVVSDQKQFEKIPGAPIAYWLSDKFIDLFIHKDLKKYCETRCGLATGQNDKYLRLWHEPSFNNVGIGFTREETKSISKRWYPYDKAGEFRKWYGNRDYILDWFHDGEELQNTMHPDGHRIWAHNFNLDKIFLPHIGWSDVISGDGGLSFRLFEKGFNFDGSANAIFPTSESDTFQILAFANSVIPATLRNVLNPTIHFKPGNFLDLPYIKEDIHQANVKTCISISKQDWDAHETSWDFEQSPLLTAIHDCRGNVADLDMLVEEEPHKILQEVSEVYNAGLIEECVNAYKSKWERLFFRLHANEEELNRQFIVIYGLGDELTPDVPLDEVTILQQGEIKITDQYALTDNGAMITDEKGRILTVKGKKYLDWQDDVIIKQLISYIVGVWMGRYRLDRPGLHIAHPNPTAEELAEYSFNISGEEEKLLIDQDAIIPVLPNEAPFFDNLRKYVEDFVEKVWGVESKTENLNYIKDQLGKDLNEYLMKDFWKDHKKMYQNRPIYWMFSSNQKGKRAAFQCLVYMHRMNRFTPEHVRTHYLLPYIETLAAREAELSGRASLSAKENKELKQLRADLEECRDYQLRLHEFADRQIEIDLDDGVVKNYATFAPVLAKLK